MTDIKGVVVVLVADGRAVAHAADFDRGGYGGFTMQEAQRMRATDAAAREFVRRGANGLIAEALDTHQCRNMVGRLIRDGRLTEIIIPIGYEGGEE